MYESWSSALWALAYRYRLDHETASGRKSKKNVCKTGKSFKYWVFLCVGSGTNESTMIRFCTHIKSLHIWGNFSNLMVSEFEDASTSFLAVEKAFLVCVSSLTTGHRLQWKSWMDSTTGCDTSKIGRSRHAWPCPRHAQSDWVQVVKTETEIGTPERVETETWKIARQRGSSPAPGTRGLYVLWNYYAANSHAATPALAVAFMCLYKFTIAIRRWVNFGFFSFCESLPRPIFLTRPSCCS